MSFSYLNWKSLMLSNKGPRIESCLYQKETQWYLDLMVKRNYHEGDTIGL